MRRTAQRQRARRTASEVPRWFVNQRGSAGEIRGRVVFSRTRWWLIRVNVGGRVDKVVFLFGSSAGSSDTSGFSCGRPRRKLFLNTARWPYNFNMFFIQQAIQQIVVPMTVEWFVSLHTTILQSLVTLLTHEDMKIFFAAKITLNSFLAFILNNINSINEDSFISSHRYENYLENRFIIAGVLHLFQGFSIELAS